MLETSAPAASRTRTGSVAQAVVDIFRDEGVPFVTGIPGSGVMQYLDVLYRGEGPRFVLVRHEQVGVHMALGYAQLTNRPAVVLVSRSPGASNAVIGTQAAFAEGTPLVLISSHVASTARGLGAFQEIDLEGVFKPITKMSVTATAASRVPGIVQEAFRVATSGRPGPVHVSIPLDFPDRDIAWQPSLPSRAVLGVTVPSEQALDDAVALLRSAQRPVIIAGGGVTKSGAGDLVLELADRLGAAVTNTWEKKAVREDHPLATGNIGRGGSLASAGALREADVILAIGCRFGEAATDDYRMALSDDQALIQVDVDPACIGRVFPVQVGLAADAAATVRALLGRFAPGTNDQGAGNDGHQRVAWRARVAEHRQAERDDIENVSWDATPVISPRVVRELRAAMAPDAVLAVDSGNFNYWVQRYYEARTPGAYIYPAATGTMGCGLPAAMGIKTAFPNRQVVAVAGDGGFLMTMQDLETCVRERINIVCVVMNNFSYGNIKIRQQTVFGNRLIGCEFGNPDFAATAALFGAHGERVSEPAEIGPALQRALSAGRPAVVDVLVDPAEICTATVRPWWQS